MKLSTLQALVAAIEEGSLRAAARRLNVAQPALTKIIRELELELGAPLLQRSSRGVMPTAEGKLLHERSVKVLRDLTGTANQIRQMNGKMIGDIHIGAVPLAVMLLIPETLRTFVREFPQVQLRISEELYVEQLQKLRSGEVDVTVGGIPDDLAQGEFHVERLISTVMVPVARKDSPWLKARTLVNLQGAPWVYTGASIGMGYARVLFEQNDLTPPERGATVNSTLAMLSLVASSDHVALLPKEIASLPIAAQYFDVIRVKEKGLPLDLAAIMRHDTALTPLMRQLLKHLHRAAHQVNHR